MPVPNINALVDNALTFRPECLRAVKTFARSKPWQGAIEDRKAKFAQLHQDLVEAHEMAATPIEFINVELQHNSGAGAYHAGTCYIAHKLSVVTYLMVFAQARGFSQERSIRWAVTLFKRCFPRSFARCQVDAAGFIVSGTTAIPAEPTEAQIAEVDGITPPALTDADQATLDALHYEADPTGNAMVNGIIRRLRRNTNN